MDVTVRRENQEFGLSGILLSHPPEDLCASKPSDDGGRRRPASRGPHDEDN